MCIDANKTGSESKDGTKKPPQILDEAATVHMAADKKPKTYPDYDDKPSTSAMLRQKLSDKKDTGWNTIEREPPPKKMTTPVWAQNIDEDEEDDDDKLNNLRSRKLESFCRSRDKFVLEVHRAIHCDTTDHPEKDSADYIEAAQNYAVFGKNMHDFPENLTKLIPRETPDPEPESTPIIPTNLGNGLFPTPTTPPDTQAHFGYQGYHHHPTTAQSTSYYQHLPNIRQHTCNTAYGLFMGNKVTYVAASPATGPVYYNHLSSTTTNFISNSITNATSPAFYFANPTIGTNSHYMNTFFQKETQFLSGGTAQTTTMGTTTSVYERMVYAHMLQQQIFHQSQQAAVAAMYHSKQRPMRPHCSGSPLSTAHPSTNMSVNARNQQTFSGGTADISAKLAAIGKSSKAATDLMSPSSD